MTEMPSNSRKPNNLPWIILGVLGGIVLLGLFGFGIYTGVKSVSDEASVTFLDEDLEYTAPGFKKIMIEFDSENNIFLNDVNQSSSEALLEALEDSLEAMDQKAIEETFFLLKMSEKTPHRSLVSVKDVLDKYKKNNQVFIVRDSEER